MKRLLLLALVVLWSIPQWAASAVLTTNGSSCPGTTNTTAIVVNLPEDKGGATLTVAGTWTGTISFYGTGSGGINGGGIWTALSVLPIGSSTAVTSTTANGTWQVNVAGFTGVCMLSSASMTGSATVTITPSAASARSNGGSSSGSGTVTSVLGTANQVDVTASTTTPTVSLDSVIKLPGTLSANVPNTAGVGLFNAGFPGTDGASKYLLDFVNQDTTSGNIIGDFDLVEYGTNFNGYVNQSAVLGWNWAPGGGPKNAAEPAWGIAFEGPYCISGSCSTQSTVEYHYWISPINGSQIRPFTTQNNFLTGVTNFMTFRSDVGVSFQYLTGDGNNISGGSLADSSGTWTLTYSSGFASTNCRVGGQIVFGGVLGGTNWSVTGYDTGSSGVIIATVGTTTLTVTGQASGLGAGTGGTFQCGGAESFTSITPSGITSSSGLVQAQTDVIVNNSATAHGLLLNPNSSGSAQEAYLRADSPPSNCPGSGYATYYFTGTQDLPYFCTSSSTSPPTLGSSALTTVNLVHSTSLGLSMNSAFAGSAGLAINTNCGSDCTTNGGGLWVSTDRGWGGPICYRRISKELCLRPLLICTLGDGVESPGT